MTRRLGVGCFVLCMVFSNLEVDARDRLRALVIIVHGTYDADIDRGLWPKVIEGKATFAAELVRGLREDADVYPFLWSTSIMHEARVGAAANLRSIIEAKASDYDKLYVVAHSHGGNVALLAASTSNCRIEKLVCLSTPHIYLATKGDNGRDIDLPVYCAPSSLTNVGEVVALFPDTDLVPDVLSNALLTGIDENLAIRQTTEWREILDHPRLANDGLFTRALERANDVLRVRVFESGNVVSSASLRPPMGDGAVHNFEITSLVRNPIDAHATIHSRRMGFVVGQILRNGVTLELHDYLSGLAIPAGADAGEPVPAAAHLDQLVARKGEIVRAGWILKHVAIELDEKAIEIAADFDHSDPDPYLRISRRGRAGGSSSTKTPSHRDSREASWNPRVLIRLGDTVSLDVLDHDPLSIISRKDKSLGKLNFKAESRSLPYLVDADIENGRYWSAELTWQPIHF